MEILPSVKIFSQALLFVVGILIDLRSEKQQTL